MKAQIPNYKIKYIECQIKEHYGERVNLICLNKQCSQNPLVCSICTSQHHKNHSYKPLKFYLDDLYKQNKQNSSQFQHQIEQLDNRKIILLLKLKECIESIAEQFMQLQQNIIDQYEKLKNQLFENQSKRNMFKEFYMTMIHDKSGDPHFQIQNYLYKDQISTLPGIESIQKLTTAVLVNIQTVKKSIQKGTIPDLIQKSIQLQPPVKNTNYVQQQYYLIPPSIKKNNDIFIQSKLGNQEVVLLNLPANSLIGKIRATIKTLPKDGLITFGLITKDQYGKNGGIYDKSNNCLWFNNKGESHGTNYCYISPLHINNYLDFFCKKNVFKAVSKSNNVQLGLFKDHFFFIALEGLCEVKITYPYLK